MRTILLLLLILLIISPVSVFAANSTIDISVKPHKVMFDLSNVKPGDYVTRDFLIENNGDESLEYIIQNKFTGGSKLFYEQLELVIEDAQGVVYDGKLYDFSELTARDLASEGNENLRFHIQIPMELTNEFQGLTADFQFNIFVDGTLGGLIPVDNRLPDTATNLFNIILVGLVLIGTGGTLYFIKGMRQRTKRVT